MNCLVTGGAGFIGSHLVELLIADGHKVRAVDNLSIGSRGNLATVVENSNFSFFEADISNKNSISNLFIDTDWVFHLAGLADIVPSIENPDAYFASNVNGTYNIAQLAKENNVKKVIYAASSSCYGIPSVYPTPENAENLERNGYWHRAVSIREEVLTELYAYQGIVDDKYFPPILGTTWSSNFGHLSLIGHHNLAQKLQILPAGDRFILNNNKSANPDVLREVSHGMQIVTQKSGTSWSDMPNFWHFSERMRTIKTVGGFIDTTKLVDEIFSENNLKLLREDYLQLSKEYSAKSLRKLEEYGLPKSSKFVALHIREGGPIGDPRTQTIASFVSSISEITKNGYWVVRVGDQSMIPLPSMNMVIDLVPKKNSASEIHAFVLASCEFYLGTHSGPAWVPRIFGIPSLITNTIEIATKVGRAPHGSIYIPKKYINQRGKMLTLSEMFIERFAYSALLLHELKSKGFSLEPNSSDEILDSTKEIIENIRGTAKNSPLFKESVDSIRHRYDAPVWGNFSNSFIHKFPEWLD